MTNPATTTQQGGAIPAQPGPREVTGVTDSATPGTKPGSGQAVAAGVQGVVSGGQSGRGQVAETALPSVGIGGESAARSTGNAAVPGLGSSVAFGPGHVPGAVIPGAGPSGKPGSRPTVKLREAGPDDPPRYAPEWLELREPADAAARAHDLLDPLRIRLANMPRKSGVVIHDLGCGTGSMGRWLAPCLDGAQHWILHDRDPYLLHFAAVSSPRSAADGSRVTVETRRGDVARLTPDALQGASLVTASALLDVLTREEIDALAAACTGAGCPALLTLSVAGRVELSPSHPLDAELTQAFNDHQRRDGLLGPDAVTAAAEAFSEHGATVRLHPSPWRLGPEQAALTEQWLRGWVGAAVEERPELRAEADVYLTNRLAALAAGELRVTVHHVDLLALSRPGGGAS
ncbi:class I SAM-dependent methyltransferase [Streptomyces massasporeus]|uniref:class I SAM-dependent methyltransferase n=1 Tax=Streptomyces massasporeus TaxID=67324 RepID=UPI003F540FAF